MTSKKTTWWVLGIALVLAVPLGFMLLNKGAPISWNIWGLVNSDDGVAIYGYDPVAYHTKGKAVPGDPTITYRWRDTNWYFFNEANRALFFNDPERYAPRFGGYCATAVSAGLTFDVDPKSFHVQDDALFLFFNDDARSDFVEQIGEGVIDRAQARWEAQ